MSWRLVDSDLIAPAMASAVDEALLLARAEGAVPDTLHLYRRSRPSISLGHFERIEECIDLEAARRSGVALVRRMSGGSAIYTDPDQIVYAVVVGQGSVPESPQETFRLLCQGVISGLRKLGVEAVFKPINDVLVRGRKISGSAQVRRHGVVLQHGTLIVRADYDRMLSVLRSKRTREEMTSLAEELAELPSMDDIKAALAAGFASALGVEMVPGTLTAEERRRAEGLARTIYDDPSHTRLY